MTINDNSTLTTLLPSTDYLLAYALPLLFLSILLAFSGTFLTLDRSRSFPPERYGVLPGAFEQKKHIHFLLEGGIGGLASGYAFGVHLSTFLSLMVPAISSSSPLNSKSFLAVWLLSSAITTFLAGRWRYFALPFIGISGGATFSVAVAVLLHPSLLARIIITAVLIPIVLILVLLPIPRTQHSVVRFATASTGAFGTVMSIALLAKVPAWENVWQRLWVSEDLTGTWGTSQEKGLDAGFCLFFAAGMACDWFLRRKFGECPDEKWDSYLANYAASLPNAANRAGTFTPFASFWDRVFGASPPITATKDVVFPDDDDADDVKLAPGKNRESFEFQRSPTFLKKGRSVGHARFHARMSGGNKRGAVKFRPIGEADLSSSDDDDDPLRSPPLSPTKIQRPWLRQKMSMSSTTPTLVDDLSSTKSKDIDFDKEMSRVRGAKKRGGLHAEGGGAPEYSDFEEDVTTPTTGKGDDGKEWSPGFLKRHRSGTNSTGSQRTAVTRSTASNPPPPPPPLAPVPATPSLIKALDRIAVAQQDAFSNSNSKPAPEGMPGSQPSSPSHEFKGARWDAFWSEVRDKAR